MYLSKVLEATQIIKAAQRIVVLTGAGMSTKSGIGDYRGATGLYKTNPSAERTLNHKVLYKDPARFYSVFGPTALAVRNAEPNEGHKFLAYLENVGGKDITIATQNIDGLHFKAGSMDVEEFHGNISTFTLCDRKNRQVFTLEDIIVDGEIQYYHQGIKEPNKLIRPNVVLFGEGIDAVQYKGILNAIRFEADVVLLLGSTFKVSPFNQLLLDYEKTVIVITQGEYERRNIPSASHLIEIDADISETLGLIQDYYSTV